MTLKHLLYSPMTRDTVEVMETDNDAQESQIISRTLESNTMSFKIVGDVDKILIRVIIVQITKVMSLHYWGEPELAPP